MNSRRIIALLTGLLLAVFAIESSAAVTAKAAVAAPASRAAMMGVTSSGQVFNLERPPSWLRPNTLVHPLHSISPDTNHAQGFYICSGDDGQCLNNWNNGGQGNLIRYYHYSTTINHNQQWNWWYEGTVDPQQSWPFTAGTNINTAYSGNPVYKFAYAPGGQGKGICISQQLFGSGDTGSQVNLTNCACGTCQLQTGSKYQYFVLDGNGKLVAVEATNLYVAAYGNNSLRIWVGVGPSGSDADAAYVYLVSNPPFAKTQFAAYM